MQRLRLELPPGGADLPRSAAWRNAGDFPGLCGTIGPANHAAVEMKGKDPAENFECGGSGRPRSGHAQAHIPERCSALMNQLTDRSADTETALRNIILVLQDHQAR